MADLLKMSDSFDFHLHLSRWELDPQASLSEKRRGRAVCGKYNLVAVIKMARSAMDDAAFRRAVGMDQLSDYQYAKRMRQLEPKHVTQRMLENLYLESVFLQYELLPNIIRYCLTEKCGFRTHETT